MLVCQNRETKDKSPVHAVSVIIHHIRSARMFLVVFIGIRNAKLVVYRNRHFCTEVEEDSRSGSLEGKEDRNVNLFLAELVIGRIAIHIVGFAGAALFIKHAELDTHRVFVKRNNRRDTGFPVHATVLVAIPVATSQLVSTNGGVCANLELHRVKTPKFIHSDSVLAVAFGNINRADRDSIWTGIDRFVINRVTGIAETLGGFRRRTDILVIGTTHSLGGYDNSGFCDRFRSGRSFSNSGSGSFGGSRSCLFSCSGSSGICATDGDRGSFFGRSGSRSGSGGSCSSGSGFLSKGKCRKGKNAKNTSNFTIHLNLHFLQLHYSIFSFKLQKDTPKK